MAWTEAARQAAIAHRRKRIKTTGPALKAGTYRQLMKSKQSYSMNPSERNRYAKGLKEMRGKMRSLRMSAR